MERIIEDMKLYHRTCIRERQRSLRSPSKSLHSPSQRTQSPTHFPFSPHQTSSPHTESNIRQSKSKQTEKRKVQDSPFIAKDMDGHQSSVSDVHEQPSTKKPFLATVKKTEVTRLPWEQEASKVKVNGTTHLRGIEESQKDTSSVFHRPFMPKEPVDKKPSETVSKNRQAMMGFMKSSNGGTQVESDLHIVDRAKPAWKTQVTTTTTSATSSSVSSSRYITPAATSSSSVSSLRYTAPKTTSSSLSSSSTTTSASRYTAPTTTTSSFSSSTTTPASSSRYTPLTTTTSSSSSSLSTTTTATTTSTTTPKRPLFASGQKAKPLTSTTTKVTAKDTKPEVEVVGTFTTAKDTPKPPVANFQGGSSETKTFHGLLDRLANIRTKISEATSDPILSTADEQNEDTKTSAISPPSPPPPLPSSPPPPETTKSEPSRYTPRNIQPKTRTFKHDFGNTGQSADRTENSAVKKTEKSGVKSQDSGFPRPILKHHEDNHKDAKPILKSQEGSARRKSHEDLLKPILKSHEDYNAQDTKPRRKSHDDLLKPILKSHEDHAITPKPILKTHEDEHETPKPILKTHEDAPSWLSHKSILKHEESHEEHPPKSILKSTSDASNRSRSTSPKPILKSSDLSVSNEKNRSRNASPKSILKTADENTVHAEENVRRSSLDSILKPTPRKNSSSPVMAQKSILKSKLNHVDTDATGSSNTVGNRFSAFTVKDSVSLTQDSKEEEMKTTKPKTKPVLQASKPAWQKDTNVQRGTVQLEPKTDNKFQRNQMPAQEGKTEWQIEAEKRAAMRGGKYDDPEFRSRTPVKKSPGTQRRHVSPAPDMKLSTVGKEPEKWQGFNLDKARSRSKSPRRLAFGERVPDTRKEIHVDIPKIPLSTSFPKMSESKVESPCSSLSNGSPRSTVSTDSPRSARSTDSPRSARSYDSPRSTKSMESPRGTQSNDNLRNTVLNGSTETKTETKKTTDDSLPKTKPEKKSTIPFSDIFRNKNRTSPPQNAQNKENDTVKPATKPQLPKSKPNDLNTNKPSSELGINTDAKSPTSDKTPPRKFPVPKARNNENNNRTTPSKPKTNGKTENNDLDELNQLLLNINTDPFGRTDLDTNGRKITRSPALKISPSTSPKSSPPLVHTDIKIDDKPKPKPTQRPQDLITRPKPEDTKTEWQLEVERRQKARRGTYIDPEKEKHLSPTPSPPPSPRPQQPQLRKIVPDKPIRFDWRKSEESEVSSPETPVAPPRKSKQKPSWMQTRPLPSPPTAEDWTPKRQIQAEKRMSTSIILEQLASIDEHLQEMEAQGRTLEVKIRAESDEAMDEDDLMVEWFELVNKKNELVRWESELMYKQRQQEYEDRHAEVEYELRLLMAKPERLWTSSDKVREQSLLQELQDIVNLRNNIVDSMEEDRIRYLEEDQEIEEKMTARAFKETPSPKKKGKKKKNKKKKEEKKKEEKKEEKKKKAKTPPPSPLELDEYCADGNTMDYKPFCFKMNKGSSGC